MYHREDGRYEYKRRDQSDVQDSYKTSRRNRWDEKRTSDVDSVEWRRDGRREESRTSTSWERKGRELEKRDHERKSSPRRSRSGGNRSRSRSRSPFRRNFRDCANPTKDEYTTYQNELHSDSVKQTHDLPSSSKKNTSWSDSSDEDEDDQTKKSNSQTASFDHRDVDERKHQVPSAIGSHIKLEKCEADTVSSSSAGISLKLGGSSTKPLPLPKVMTVPVSVKSAKVAAIFNADDDDEPEEMPPECKMRMKNVGRETKTSEGPNSFGKTKIGFCNMSHLAEKRLGDKTGAIKKP